MCAVSLPSVASCRKRDCDAPASVKLWVCLAHYEAEARTAHCGLGRGQRMILSRRLLVVHARRDWESAVCFLSLILINISVVA